MNRLDGKVAIVTGGAGGIGAAIAKSLVDRGARVAIADLNFERAQAIASQLGAGKGVAVRLDVAREDEWLDAREAIARSLGPVDILINNAGVGFGGSLDTVPLDAWRWVYEVNVLGAVTGVQTFLPGMKERAGEGHVLFMGSITALHPIPKLGAYASSKSALISVASILRAELASTGIGVTIAMPGSVSTDILVNAEQVRPEALRAYTAELPSHIDKSAVKKLGMEPQFVGEAVAKAILDNQFYLFTHHEYASGIAADRDQMLAAMTHSADPSYREQQSLISN